VDGVLKMALIEKAEGGVLEAWGRVSGGYKEKNEREITRVFEICVNEAVHLIRVDGDWRCGHDA
jgi:hypothetical protein